MLGHVSDALAVDEDRSAILERFDVLRAGVAHRHG
jgi:hypothetical protein